MQLLKKTFSEKQKTSEAKFNVKRQNLDSDNKNGNKAISRGKTSTKRCIRARLQYLQRGYKAGEATSPAACFALL